MTGALLMLMAVGGDRVDISGGGGAIDVAEGAAFAQIAFESDGDIVSTTSVGSSDDGDWIAPKAVAPSAYEIRAHKDSGATPDGSALDTWLPLTSNRSWSLTQSGAGAKSASLTISIRIGGTVVSSGVFVLSAEAL